MPDVRSAADAAVGEFYAARQALATQIGAALVAAHLPPRAVGQAGWSTVTSVGRGIQVEVATADRQPPAAADLAPHQAALEAAGLRVKPRELDGRPVLLVFPGEGAVPGAQAAESTAVERRCPQCGGALTFIEKGKSYRCAACRTLVFPPLAGAAV